MTPPPTPPPPVAPSSKSLLGQERRSLRVHQDVTFRGSAFSLPRVKPRATFAHGFFLPFSLIIAMLRHPTLGASYLRLTVARALVVAVLSYFAFHNSTTKPGGPEATDSGHHRPKSGFTIEHKIRDAKPHIVVREVPEPPQTPEEAAADAAAAAAAEATATPPGFLKRTAMKITNGWQWIVWFVGIVSATEAVIVFFTRRWDDWLGFYASSMIARIRPEDPQPTPPKLAFDIKWLFRKLKRRIRGYLVFGAGIPLIALFRLVPGQLYDRFTIGDLLFSIALTCWGWYWLAVFTAGKSAHAWTDANGAPSPMLIRELRDRTDPKSGGRWFLRPVHWYSRLWAWVTNSLNPAAMTFEKNPRPFLGLALARVILALPGLYLLARPIVPIAAGRLCAESDLADRFSSSTNEPTR